MLDVADLFRNTALDVFEDRRDFLQDSLGGRDNLVLDVVPRLCEEIPDGRYRENTGGCGEISAAFHPGGDSLK